MRAEAAEPAVDCPPLVLPAAARKAVRGAAGPLRCIVREVAHDARCPVVCCPVVCWPVVRWPVRWPAPFMGVFNNLIVYDQQKALNSPDTIVPDLAGSWAWDEKGTRLTFTLRTGVRWHDGKPFSARDVQ